VFLERFDAEVAHIHDVWDEAIVARKFRPKGKLESVSRQARAGGR